MDEVKICVSLIVYLHHMPLDYITAILQILPEMFLCTKRNHGLISVSIHNVFCDPLECANLIQISQS
jgi:hypothetical protein